MTRPLIRRCSRCGQRLRSGADCINATCVNEDRWRAEEEKDEEER